MSDLEKDFDKVAEQINAKLKEAAVAIQEATRLSEKVGLPSLIFTQFLQDDMRHYNPDGLSKDEIRAKIDALEVQLQQIDVRELEAALGNAGWSTSSSYC